MRDSERYALAVEHAHRGEYRGALMRALNIEHPPTRLAALAHIPARWLLAERDLCAAYVLRPAGQWRSRIVEDHAVRDWTMLLEARDGGCYA